MLYLFVDFCKRNLWFVKYSSKTHRFSPSVNWNRNGFSWMIRLIFMMITDSLHWDMIIIKNVFNVSAGKTLFVSFGKFNFFFFFYRENLESLVCLDTLEDRALRCVLRSSLVEFDMFSFFVPACNSLGKETLGSCMWKISVFGHGQFSSDYVCTHLWWYPEVFILHITHMFVLCIDSVSVFFCSVFGAGFCFSTYSNQNCCRGAFLKLADGFVNSISFPSNTNQTGHLTQVQTWSSETVWQVFADHTLPQLNDSRVCGQNC